jgi:hypothetical protein
MPGWSDFLLRMTHYGVRRAFLIITVNDEFLLVVAMAIELDRFLLC